VTSNAQRQALRDASQWFARMCASPDHPGLQEQWHHWHRQNPLHQWAWERLTLLQSQVGSVPGGLAYQVLDKTSLQPPALGRRTLLKGLVLAAGAGSLGWQGYREAPVWLADLSTRIGQQRRERLSDGSVIVLDTGSAVDIAFDSATRLLILRAGEIHLTSAKDPRPLVVRSAQGDMRALGTRFSVRQNDQQTRLNVYEHAVAVRPQQASAEQIIQSGQSVHFDARAVLNNTTLAPGEEAWAQGRLVVEGWRLDRLVSELQRYRSGYLGCAPQVGHLKVSGSYRLDDIDVTLAAIARALPVKVERYTAYWTRLVAG
jgi:transmembrane sensor